MRTLLTIALLFSPATALAATHRAVIEVAPQAPAPTQAVTVGFDAPAAVGDGRRWYAVAVTAPSRSSKCEYYEETDATTAAKGSRVSVTLRPVDKHRWCAGEYDGEVSVERRVPCGDRIDEGICSEPARKVGSFHFSVAAQPPTPTAVSTIGP